MHYVSIGAWTTAQRDRGRSSRRPYWRTRPQWSSPTTAPPATRSHPRKMWRSPSGSSPPARSSASRSWTTSSPAIAATGACGSCARSCPGRT